MVLQGPSESIIIDFLKVLKGLSDNIFVDFSKDLVKPSGGYNRGIFQ